MYNDEQLEPIRIEVETIENILNEINGIIREYSDSEPDIRIKAALASFIAQFYNGVENIMKRIMKINGRTLPKGENWHAELFNQFIESDDPNTPVLFRGPDVLINKKLRKFRHIVYHGYSFRLEYELMKSNVMGLQDSFKSFVQNLKANNLI
ncbi:hypothetical protein MASR1M107_31880 [Ignavibacteriales bacterium]